MRRSRGGLTTKIHAIVDRKGLPIALKLTPGQAHDGRSAEDMLDVVSANAVLLADHAYDSNAIRERLDSQGAFANIRPLSCRREKPMFSAEVYKLRNRVERFFNRIRHFRAVATRYDCHDANYLASVQYESVS